MKKSRILSTAIALSFGLAVVGARSASADWLQFGHDERHSGFQPDVAGQRLDRIISSRQFDTASIATGTLGIHYDVPKADATGVYIPNRDGSIPNIVYSVQKLDRSGNVLWTYQSDYNRIVGGWEAAFSFALGNGNLYVAGLYGVMHVISPDDGSPRGDIVSYPIPDPPPPGLAGGVAVSGPPAIDAAGKLYYVVRSTFSGSPPVRSHLAVANPDGTIFGTVNFADLTGQANERPGLNCGPAVAPDGTIYVGTHVGGLNRLLAINPDLTLKWIGDMASDPDHVGLIIDQSTSTPVVGPDGQVFYGGWNSNELSDGYLYRFSPGGQYLGYYPFGWDTTPGIYPDPDGDPTHYHLIQKLNKYVSRRYFLVSINPNQMGTDPDPDPLLHGQEWSWELPTPGRELCVNAVVIDSSGASYFLGEDGIFYRVEFGGVNYTGIMLGAPRDAAYTPAAMASDGTIYALSDRSFYIVGNAP